MLDWILNTPLVKVVRTQIWNHFPSKSKTIVPANKQTNKQIIGKKNLNFN